MKKFIAGLLTGVSILLLLSFVYEKKDKKTIVDEQLEVFNSFFHVLNEHYVAEVDAEKLIRLAIDKTVSALDPHSKYFNKEETEERKKKWKGVRYSGIGAGLNQRDGKTYITYANEGFPAWKSELRAGDVIKLIDERNVEEAELSDIVQLLRGKKGTKVKLTVQRSGDNEVTKELVREEIKSPPLPFYSIVNEEVGYIKYSHFLQGASDELKSAFLDLKQQKMQYLIIDLRKNSGGLVKEAIRSLGFFLPDSTRVCELKGKHSRANYAYHTKKSSLDTLIPLVLLTDNNTVSSGEIFAGAVQDLDRGVIIGEKSYGKGLVQGTRFPGKGTSLYLTVASYYTPSGRCIQKFYYSDRNKGLIKVINDSLKKEFKTINGRPVYNIGGISPDIEVKQTELPQAIYLLKNNYLYFDYAVQYRNSHDAIAAPNQFKLTEKETDAFMAFVANNGYFKMETETQFEKLVAQSTEEGVYDFLKESLNPLEEKLLESKKNLLVGYRKAIKKRLEQEIIRHYYFNSGLIKSNLPNDSAIQKGIEILLDKKEYNRILGKK